MPAIAIIEMTILFSLLGAYNIVYWVFIYPAVRASGKTTFLKSLLLYGTDISGLYEYERLVHGHKMRRIFAIQKYIGLSLLVAILLSMFSFPYVFIEMESF
ncbi:MAG: hypothetical protein SWE60_13430 [Thermodesulfobacteriota bacterium]|nr:hypothetical protein [Thermodesulfobacteriota bacterium]